MQGVERMLAEWQITKTIWQFNHFLDNCRYTELIALFTEDCTFDRLGQILCGRQEIADAYAQRHPFLTRHFVNNIIFTRVDADEAEASMYAANFIGQPATAGLPVGFHFPQPAIFEFVDTYKLIETSWLIHKRRVSMLMQPMPPAPPA